MQRRGTVHVSTAKSVRHPDWAILQTLYYKLCRCQRSKSCGTFCWLVDRIVSSMRQGDNKKQTQYSQGISGQRRKLCLLKKMLRKTLPSFLDVLHCCSCCLIAFYFFLGFIMDLLLWLHCVGLLWGHDAYVAAVAIAIRLKPSKNNTIIFLLEMRDTPNHA